MGAAMKNNSFQIAERPCLALPFSMGEVEPCVQALLKWGYNCEMIENIVNMIATVASACNISARDCFIRGSQEFY